MVTTPGQTWSAGEVVEHADLSGFLPWNAPWGRIAYATKSADQNTISTTVDVSSLSVAPTLVAGRRIRTRAYLYCTQNTSANAPACLITDGSNVEKARFTLALVATGIGMFLPEAHETPGAGTFTRKIRIGTGGGTVSVNAATQLAWIAVYDDGPVTPI